MTITANSTTTTAEFTALRNQHSIALLCPDEFSQRMLSHWTTPRDQGGLEQQSSQALIDLWRIMGANFQTAIVEAVTGVLSPWRILQPPTGTGKTQGTCVYAAMQSDYNRDTAGALRPVGMLIVTRLKEEANNIRDTINRLAGRTVAVVHHSDNYASPEQLYESDVVVITHAAFRNAKKAARDNDGTAWDRLVSWRGGDRCLTVIDEALANLIDEASINAAHLKFVINQIPSEVRTAFPQQVAVIEHMHSMFAAFDDSDADGCENAMSQLWGDEGVAVDVDFAPFIAVMATQPYDRIVHNLSSAKRQAETAATVTATIAAVRACLGQFAYYFRSGILRSINTAALVIPLDAPGPVVLDATARANFLWELFGDKHVRPAVPSRTRDYSTVTLHVARGGGGVGKGTMAERVKERMPRIKKGLEEAIGPDSSVFLCVHQDVEEAIKRKPKKAKSWVDKLSFKQCSVGHWGAVDGRNTWQDCDTAVILGLPYPPHTWSTNMFYALQGAQDDKWQQSPEWKQYKDVRKVMEQRHISVSVIQAINRIRCRRVVDAEGHCPPADIYIVLPKDALGDAVLDDIKADMPGIKVTGWDFALDAPKEKTPRIGSTHARVIDHMRKQPDGPVSLSNIQKALHIPGVRKLREALNKSDHPATLALKEIGVTYVPGNGRGSTSYLVKASDSASTALRIAA